MTLNYFAVIEKNFSGHKITQRSTYAQIEVVFKNPSQVHFYQVGFDSRDECQSSAKIKVMCYLMILSLHNLSLYLIILEQMSDLSDRSSVARKIKG